MSTNLALHHPSAKQLLAYAMGGCPVKSGHPWTLEEILAAVQKGAHSSALVPKTMEQLQAEVKMKVLQGQANVFLWDDIKDNPPKELKVSPIAMIPHKSQAYHAILDLSLSLHLQDGSKIPLVNESMQEMAPLGELTN